MALQVSWLRGSPVRGQGAQTPPLQAVLVKGGWDIQTLPDPVPPSPPGVTHLCPGPHPQQQGPRDTPSQDLAAGALSLQVEPRTAAAVTIQAWWRGQLVRRALLVADTSARRIQAWWQKVASQQQERQRLQVLVDYMRTERASVLLQAQVRAWAARAKYKRCQEAARTIQARWREHACRGCGRPASLLAGCSGPC
uniref:IQ motif containing F6 n=1 Tax=Anser cygnoides TaxID=8845 RepID=A0A8B9ENQ3_ANSCY